MINRAYCDRSNHPDANARLNLEQSWKRTSGWALERILVAHYGPFLMENGISAKISSKSEKTALLGGIDDSRIVPDKADILLTYGHKGQTRLLGVVHVKASIAERRTDDVPMSQALLQSGYVSVFWTMDSKSFPGTLPVNFGEFGDASDNYRVASRNMLPKRSYCLTEMLPKSGRCLMIVLPKSWRHGYGLRDQHSHEDGGSRSDSRPV